MGMAAPVTCAPASDARCTRRAATCDGCTHCEPSALGSPARFPGVSIVPGNTVLAEMHRSLFSRAIVRTSEASAAFEALWRPPSPPARQHGGLRLRGSGPHPAASYTAGPHAE